ncbi:MAG TPA: glycosyltransferase family 4 protein [Mycobacterium sp.]|nr:glycosyltransferase family 4 protein [Mycobacterium sp.]
MRIGLVCPYSLSAPGGVQQQVLGLARALERQGHEVSIVAPGEVPRDCSGISVGRAFGFRVNGSIAPMAPQPTAAARAVRAIRRGGFDVLHLHEPLAPSITIPVLLAHPAPMVGTFHAAGHRTPYRWAAPLLRGLASRIDVRVAVSEPAAQLAQQHLGGSYELLFNGIDVSRYRAPAAEAAGMTILFLGRHEPRKGLDVLLDALPLLPRCVSVRVAGNGPATARLRERHRGDERIRWLGRLTEADKIRELHAASVLCAPSRHGESFGMVLLEALAAGTPIVASDVPGYRSLSSQADAAHFVPPGDPNALAAGLLRVLCDRRLAADLRAKRADFITRFSMDALALRYAQIYDSLSTKRSGNRLVGRADGLRN